MSGEWAGLAEAGGEPLEERQPIGPALRDIRQMLPMILQFGLFATPIGYGLEVIPEKYWPLYSLLNPLVPVIDGYRRTVLLGAPPRRVWWANVSRKCRGTARPWRSSTSSGSAPGSSRAWRGASRRRSVRRRGAGRRGISAAQSSGWTPADVG